MTGFDISNFTAPKLYENYKFISQDAAETGQVKDFKAKIRRNLIPSEVASLEVRDAVYDDESGEELEPAKQDVDDFWDDMAEHVTEWNLQAVDQTSGKLVKIPPPAEVGGEVFALLPTRIAVDIYHRLKFGPQKALRDNAKN